MVELYKLTNETIDMISEKISEMYKECGATKKDVLRARLLLEETLIKYKNHFNEDIELYFRRYKLFNQNRFVIRIKAPSFDPFTLEENPMAFMIQSVMNTFEGNVPTWKYHNLENEIVFTIVKKAKISGILKIAIAVALAIAIGIPLRFLVPADNLTYFVTSYLNPLADAYAGLYCIMAVPMTFFAIALSIINIGDMNAAGAIGGKILRKFYIMSAVIVVVLTLPILPFYELSSTAAAAISAKSIYDILIGFIPSNIVAPFLNFNSIHIMIVGAMFGFALLSMGQKGEHTVKVFDECNLVTLITNGFFNKFICFYVGLKVFALITTSDFTELAGAGRLVAMILIGELLIFTFYVFYVHFKTKIPIKKYFKALFPAMAVCLSSANFGTAFQLICEGLISLDVFDGRTSNISMNLGCVVFRPACTLVFVFSSLAMAASYGIDISVSWVVIAVILSLLLVAAVPNVPGVSIPIITLLFSQLGLPAEAIAMMITINAPLQFVTVAVDSWCLSCECAIRTYKDKQAQLAKA